MAFLDETGLAELWDVIRNKHDGFVNEYVWGKRGYEPQSFYLGARESVVVKPSGWIVNTISYATDISVTAQGMVSLVSYQLYDMNPYKSTTEFASVLNGKYLIPRESSSVYYISTSATWSVGDDGTITCSSAQQVYGKAEAYGLVGYVNSPNPNAYPPAVSDGYTYTPMGRLGEKTRIEEGSYIGTNKGGSSNPTSLTFGFKPTFFIVWNANGDAFFRPVGYGVKYAQVQYGINTSYQLDVTWNGNTVTWYYSGGSNGPYQLNGSGTYNYVAIG